MFSGFWILKFPPSSSPLSPSTLDSPPGLGQCARMHPIHYYPRLAGALWLLMSGLALAAPAPPGTNYLIRGWQIENGLPQNKLAGLLQAADGYVYIGTANGLVRFDGVRFRVF